MKNTTQYISTYSSPIGELTLASNGPCLTGAWFDGQKYFGSTLTNEYEQKSLPVFEQTKAWLNCYFSGKVPDFTPDLHLTGTPFRLEVWEILKGIPYGKTVTYKEIAETIALSKGLRSISAQAVGNAVGHNPIGILIPCHRVIGCNGSLTGYAGGIDKKISLLTLEQADTSRLFFK